VSNTDNVNILCKYLMYIMTDYRLILTKDRPDLSSERQTLAWLCWREPAATVNYIPVLSSERALQNNKLQLSKRKSQGEKIGRGSHMGPWHQDWLADWLSVVMWLWLWLDRICGLVVRVPGYRPEIYCASCEVQTVNNKQTNKLRGLSPRANIQCDVMCRTFQK
jgi:hypothetical protein